MEVKFLPVPFLRSNRIFSAEVLLKAAKDKHSRHYKQFDQHLDYILLYPDKTIVQSLPGSSVPYTLNKYKEELGKPFSKLYFWLCRTSDIPRCIPLKRALRAVSQDNQTFQILPRQLIQKQTKEMAPQEYHAAKLRQVRQLMEL